MHLAPSSIEAGLLYCRWLESNEFNKRLRVMAPSLPPARPTVFLNDQGKRAYDMALRHVSESRREGGVLLKSGEPAEVRQFLLGLKASQGRQPTSSTSRTGTKHATLQLHAVSKFLSNGKRTIRGIANSGLLDRVGDVVDPMGGSWTLPLPLLWQHKHDQPIGWVRAIDARSDGLHITAELASGIGKADEAWAMIEVGLVESYSVGFQATEWKPLPGGGKRFTAWSLHEISVVTIPADPSAKIRRNTGGAVRITRSNP